MKFWAFKICIFKHHIALMTVERVFDFSDMACHVCLLYHYIQQRNDLFKMHMHVNTDFSWKLKAHSAVSMGQGITHM